MHACRSTLEDPTDRWEPQQFLSLLRREEDAGGPYLGGIVVRIFKDKAAIYRDLEAGRVDFVRKVQRDVYDRLVAGGALSGLRWPSNEYLYLAWNTRHAPWSRAEARQALTAWIDRQAIAARFEGSGSSVAEGPVPPGDPRYDATLRSPAYDPRDAERRFAALGVARSPDGKWLDARGKPLLLRLLCVAGNSLHRDVASAVADYLRRGGFEVDLRALDAGPLEEQVAAGDFDAALYVRPRSARVDLAGCFGADGIDNRAGLDDPELEGRLADRSDAAFREAYRRIVELQPWTFLYYPMDSMVHSRRLHGLEANPVDPISVVERWWIPAELQ